MPRRTDAHRHQMHRRTEARRPGLDERARRATERARKARRDHAGLDHRARRGMRPADVEGPAGHVEHEIFMRGDVLS